MNDIESQSQSLIRMITGYWITQAIHVAAEFGIADRLAQGPQTVEQLAARDGLHADPLYRVLRALASMGIFTECADRTFALTPLAERLQSDAPGSQRAFARMMGAEMYQAWGNLRVAVQSGEEPFKTAFGRPVFQYMLENPDRHAIFDALMTGVHDPETVPMIDAYDFASADTVVDVGGGNGLALDTILRRHHHLQGILFDLPPVADRAREKFSRNGLAGRIQVVGGDFFERVPEGGDIYLMRHVIHDWPDDPSIAILRHCRDAMKPGGRVVLGEFVVPPADEPGFGKWLDLMMVVIGGRERTEAEYRTLYERAGLRLNRIVPTAHEISLIEGVRAD